MQLLESDDKTRYERTRTMPFTHTAHITNVHIIFFIRFVFRFSSFWIFRKSGRIGTNIGQTNCVEFDCSEQAVKQFRADFKQFTGNEFGLYQHFVKQPDKYQWLKIDHDAHNDVLKSLVPSRLNNSNRRLMALICDQKAMKNTMFKFDLDSDNMPLGKFNADSILYHSSIHENCD